MEIFRNFARYSWLAILALVVIFAGSWILYSAKPGVAFKTDAADSAKPALLKFSGEGLPATMSTAVEMIVRPRQVSVAIAENVIGRLPASS